VAAWFVPAVNWLLVHTHTALERLSILANRFRELPSHSRLYEKQDLLDLFDRQKEQPDNRIAHEDLDLMSRALTFKNIRAIDVAQPRKASHVVNANDAIGPILLDQLHKYHQASFLVYKDTKENIIGTLAMSDAVTAKHGGRVLDLIRSELIYVHEDFSARQVLTAFHKTGHQIAAVINNAEEFVGTITVDHLLQALLGEVKDDEVTYADRAAIASYDSSEDQAPSKSSELTEEQNALNEQAELLTKESAEDISTAPSSPEATEVVQ
jgi:CBS domain containing-hemolysin-like protein